MKLYRSAQLRQIETHSLAQGLPLMERAGAAAAALACQLAGGKKPTHFLIFCGSGNNGGDGLVAARLLQAQGHAVSVICPAPGEHSPADARAAHAAWLGAGGHCHTALLPAPQMRACDVLIDAIFGLGLNRPPAAPFSDWIKAINTLAHSGKPVLALDLPSGLQADTGITLGCAVRASHTLAFIGSSLGLHTADGCDHAGQISVTALNLDLHAFPFAAQINQPQHFAAALQTRANNSHKGDFGNARIIGGAAGMVGAALLAGRAALHMGAGRTFVGLLDAAAPAVDYGQPELMLKSAQAVLATSGALCLGPGLGQSAEALACLHTALNSVNHPLLLDADALNLLAAHPDLTPLLHARAAAGHITVLTPHEAEAGRLLGCHYRAVHAERYAAAQQLAEKYQTIVLLKGCGSIVATPAGQLFINPTGTPALATGGSGDVLSGLITGLLAQADESADATLAAVLAGVYVHGRAAEVLGIQRGLAAGELIASARAELQVLAKNAPKQPSKK
jgi:hydroxyethylthiazole kinase-like uncharacterized protein yjeF